MRTATAPIKAISRETITTINLARRLPRRRSSARRGRLQSMAFHRLCRSLLVKAGKRCLERRLLKWLDILCGPRCILGAIFLEPDLLHQHSPIAKEADFYPPDIGLIEVLRKPTVVLRDPRGICHDKLFHLAIERDSLC